MPLIARIQQPPINSLDFLGPIISIALPHGRSDAVVKPPFSMVWDEGKRRGLAAKKCLCSLGTAGIFLY